MARKPNPKSVVSAILERYPKSFSEEIGIDLSANTPAPLFQWLVACLLFSTRISMAHAQSAARALFENGWTTPDKMAASSWEDRVKVLNQSGYARYDESTARYIADATDFLRDTYSGDLRKLRDAAERSPFKERKLLKEFKGIGDVGADIFLREVQVTWEEAYPFADTKALSTAEELGLAQTAEDLADLAGTKLDFVRLLSGLIRISLAKETEEILAEAS